MKKRWLNNQGRSGNLVRFEENDWKKIEEYIKEHGLKKQEYYEKSCTAFLEYYGQNKDINFVLTPFTKTFVPKTIYLFPDIHSALDEIAEETGFSIGRIMATAVLFLVR
mgnify:CR=1 FL=1